MSRFLCQVAVLFVGASALAGEVERIGTIADPDIKECSGIVASHQYAGVFWTHNDGKKERVYAIDRRGATLATFKLTGAKFEDWEDLALDSSNNLYAADTGNNDGKRESVVVYQFSEPDPKSTEKSVAIKRQWELRFPARPFDCESLMILGTNGYVVSKLKNNQLAEVYAFSLAAQGAVTLKAVGRLAIDSPVTAAAVSPDKKKLAAISKLGMYVFEFTGSFPGGTLWPSRQVRFPHDSIEACTFVPEGLLVAAESRELFLFKTGSD